MSAITVWDNHTAESFTYTDLPVTLARTVIKMVETGSGFLVAYASDDIAPLIHPRIRTSWFTHNLPPEPDGVAGV
jgi:hypothetical protein